MRKLMNEWPLQDAKNRFSAIVDAAVAGNPQRVMRRGSPRLWSSQPKNMSAFANWR